MKYLIRDSARWAAAGLAAGVLVAMAAAAVSAMEFSSAVALAIVIGGMGMCLGPLALVVHRAAQVAGRRRLAMGTLWGGMWGMALGLLYWGFCGNTFPVWHVMLPTAILAAAGLLNTALDVDMAATSFPASRSPWSHSNRPR